MAHLDRLWGGLRVSAGEFRGSMIEVIVWLCTPKDDQTCELVTRKDFILSKGYYFKSPLQTGRKSMV